MTNITLSGNGTIAGPNFSLSIAGVDSTPFTVLRDGLDGFVGSLVQRQIAKFNPAGSPTDAEIRAIAKPFLDVVDNDPAACLAELNAGIALHLRLSTLQTLLDQWVADFKDLVQTEGHLLTNLLVDLFKLGLSLTPFVGQLKQAVGAAQLTLEESEFILATIDASVTLSESLTQLAVNIITGKGPDDVGLALKGFFITFVGQLATAAGLKGGGVASIPFIQKFMSKHGGLVKFLGPITAILTIGVDILANSESIVAAEKKCANDKTTYLNAVAEAQRDIRVLAQAIIDCHRQKENKPEPLPPPPAPKPVAWSSNNLPNLIHVTSNLDNGQLGAVVPGSLRAAINQVNTGQFAGPVELDFSQLTNTTILLQQDLPPINFPVYIFGMAGANCTMLVIDGSQIPAFETQNTGGQAFDLKANNSTIRFVDFVNFAGNPVLIQGNNDTIYACHVGVNITGKVATPNGGVGIAVTGSNNTVGSIVPGNGDIVSSNGLTGIGIFDGTGNLVEGNIIGLDAAGTVAMGNGGKAPSNQDGSGVDVDSASNTIGGAIPGMRNIISANFQQGISVGGKAVLDQGVFGGNNAAANTVIMGNFIGTDRTGELALGNLLDGILIDGVSGTMVGGISGTLPSSGLPAAGNLISGNHLRGVEIDANGATGNQVVGNYIGVDALGTSPLGNIDDGVEIDSGAGGNTIGGSAAAALNVISGNLQSGIAIASGAGSNLVIGNFIGTDRTGTAGRQALKSRRKN